jgi:hypothetical protein
MTDMEMVVVYFVALFQYLPEETWKNQGTSPVRIADLIKDVSTRHLCPLSS